MALVSRRWFLCILFATAAVSFAKVKAETGKDIDFSKYKTYQWFPPRVLLGTGIVEDDDLYAPLIRTAVNRELTQRGLTEVKTGGDLQISSWALADYVPTVDELIYHGGIRVTAGTDVWVGSPIHSIGQYNKKGSLIVNLIDSSTKKTAWVAVATESIARKDKPGSKIDKAVTDMFKKYPGSR